MLVVFLCRLLRCHPAVPDLHHLVLMIERTFNAVCGFVGLRLLALGLQLSGFRIVCFYNSPDRDAVLAIHAAVTAADLNSSMREFVERLDASYYYEL